MPLLQHYSNAPRLFQGFAARALHTTSRRNYPPARSRYCSLVVLAFAVIVGGCSPTRALEATFVLSDIVVGQGPSHLKRETSQPRRELVAYHVADRLRTGDLYEPAEPVAASVVVVPGVASEGKDDPRLVAFATTLARARFRVLVPEIASLRALKVAPADAQDIADAIRYVDGERAPEVGVVAFSYALGPAVLASLEPDIGRHVDFIVAIGGYYDIEAVVTFFTTGFYRPDVGGAWQYRVPNEYGKWVFARSNADRLASATDREALMEIARLKMTDPKADVAALAAGLGSEGRAVYALLTNQLPENVPRLIADLPDSIRSDLHALDLKQRDLSPLAGRLILVHGRDDPIIPFSESRKLARATPNSDLYVVDTLAHVDLGPSGVVDALKLLYVIYNLLERRDALAATVH